MIKWILGFGLFWSLFSTAQMPLQAGEALSGFEIVEPSDVGFSSEKLGLITEAMQGFVERGDLSGMVTLIARDGKILAFEAVGKQDVDSGTPMAKDSIFRIYSMSKPITNVAAMTLVEQGKFDLDDPISKYLAEFQQMKVYVEGAQDQSEYADLEREITVRDLMRHTSGFSYGFFGDTPVDQLYRSRRVLRPDASLEEFAATLGEIPLLYQPGTRFHYSVSTDVLGYLVEVVSGVPFDQYLETTIFEPLGMVDTGFDVPQEKLSRFTTNYGKSEEGELRSIDRPSSSRFSRPATLFSGGGGLVSTALDYLRFTEMLRNGGELDGVRILQRESVAEMTRDQLSTDSNPIPVRGPYAHGLGFGVLLDNRNTGGSVGEFQWGGAASTIFWVDPVEELSVIVMTQFMPSRTYPLRSTFKNLVYDALVAEISTSN